VARSPFDRESAPFAGNTLKRMTAATSKSLPVLDTDTSPAPAIAATRTDAQGPSSPIISHSPARSPGRTAMPSGLISSALAQAQRPPDRRKWQERRHWSP